MGLQAANTSIAEISDCIQNDSELEISHEWVLENFSSSLFVKYDTSLRRAMTNCIAHCREFFKRRKEVQSNELIIHWILEGYFSYIDHIGDAFDEGHNVLMALIHHGILQVKENSNDVTIGAKECTVDVKWGGFLRNSSMGLTSMLEDGRWKGFGPVVPTDGMIKTEGCNEKREKISTLLIAEKVSDKFFQGLEGLEVVALFNLGLSSLPQLFSSLKKLSVLVIRNCHLLDNINSISELKELTVLEISGSSALEIIPPKLFQTLTGIQILNFSGSLIRNLPPTLSELRDLCWLILRHCHRLKTLPKMQTLRKLEKLDLFEATSFSNFEDRSFTMLPKLKVLDISQTLIERLPIVRNLKELTQLLLRGCKRLYQPPNLNLLPSLQVLDLSNAHYVEELNYSSHESLIILDLSGTQINHILAIWLNFQNSI